MDAHPWLHRGTKALVHESLAHPMSQSHASQYFDFFTEVKLALSIIQIFYRAN